MPIEERVAFMRSGSTAVSSRRMLTYDVLPYRIEDRDRLNCWKCQVRFSAFSVRHHCRSCGDIYCNKCSLPRAVLPFKSEEYSKAVRICDYCHEHISRGEVASLLRLANVIKYDPNPSNKVKACTAMLNSMKEALNEMSGNGGQVPEDFIQLIVQLMAMSTWILSIKQLLLPEQSADLRVLGCQLLDASFGIYREKAVHSFTTCNVVPSLVECLSVPEAAMDACRALSAATYVDASGHIFRGNENCIRSLMDHCTSAPSVIQAHLAPMITREIIMPGRAPVAKAVFEAGWFEYLCSSVQHAGSAPLRLLFISALATCVDLVTSTADFNSLHSAALRCMISDSFLSALADSLRIEVDLQSDIKSEIQLPFVAVDFLSKLSDHKVIADALVNSIAVPRVASMLEALSLRGAFNTQGESVDECLPSEQLSGNYLKSISHCLSFFTNLTCHCLLDRSSFMSTSSFVSSAIRVQ